MIRGLLKLPDGKDWLWGNLGLALMGGAMFNKSLIQFSANRKGEDTVSSRQWDSHVTGGKGAGHNF